MRYIMGERTCESNILLLFFLVAVFSITRLLDPRGLCKYTSAVTSSSIRTKATNLFMIFESVRQSCKSLMEKN